MATTKEFDCIAFKRVAQEKIYEQIKGMTPAEEVSWFRQKVQSGQFSELWKRIAARDQKPDSYRCAEDEVNYSDKSAIKVAQGINEKSDSILASKISPEMDSNPGGVYLRGIRLREEMTQEELAKLTGISRSNISAMEHGKRPIGKETAKKLAAVLNCDYRLLL